ncbi:MAG: coproporphyrinogen III oxidase family protein [Dehalococcoidia bacterium]|nr:MAG: coproporphyrinogen III oxidase family protein [Dehalococcoidia bacterium]
MSNNNWLVKNLADFAGGMTRRGGREFLHLSEEIETDQIKATPENAGRASLYIHIPFCRTLCPFCCFNRYLFAEDKARSYFKSLKKEVALYKDRGFRFSSLYFGGGTPTILMDELGEFIAYLKENFAIKEISLETTHREINHRTIEQLKQAGINRLSIGVQSFDDAISKSMGRAWSTGQEAGEKLLMAEGQFDTVNADFIFNFPGQTLKQFEADVLAFKEMKLDQATFYPLMPSPHKMSALERRFKFVDTSHEKDFYDILLRELYDGDYRASTAWCFSRGERMIDEYVIEFDDYVGVGAGSVGFLEGNFYVNTFSLERYARLIDEGRLPVVRWKKLSERESRRYYLLTKLFGMALDPTQFERRFGADIHRKLGLELAFFKMFGLVQEDGLIRVTRRGMYPVSSMMKEFFAALNGLREYCIEHGI